MCIIYTTKKVLVDVGVINSFGIIFLSLLPPASAVEVIKTEPSVCVCVSVCEHSHGWTNWGMVTKFGTEIDLDDLSAEFDGQGHRSKIKVIQLTTVIFGFLAWVLCAIIGVRAWKRFMGVHALNSAHANFAHVHAWNQIFLNVFYPLLILWGYFICSRF